MSTPLVEIIKAAADQVDWSDVLERGLIAFIGTAFGAVTTHLVNYVLIVKDVSFIKGKIESAPTREEFDALRTDVTKLQKEPDHGKSAKPVTAAERIPVVGL